MSKVESNAYADAAAPVASRDPHAYLKWPRLIMFNLNGALSIAATAVAARSLVILNGDKKTLAATVPGAKLHVANVVAATACMTTAAGIASLYTAALSTAITLKWHRVETRTSIAVKEMAMIFMAVLLLVAAIIATVIIVPRSAGASAPGIPDAVLKRLIESTGKSLAYRDSLAFDALIIVWITFGTTLICFILAALAARHIRKYGPENTLVGHAVSSKQGLLHRNGHGRGSFASGNGTMVGEKPATSHVEHVEGVRA